MNTPGSAPGQAETFSNAPLTADHLPQVHEQAFAPLDPAYARVRALGAALAAAVIVTVSIAAWVLLSSPAVVIVGGVLLVFVATIGLAQRLETNHMGYLVRELDLSLCSGVIGRSVATAPFSRVQHVSMKRGPIDRRYGLAVLQLRTAGGHITIPGLRHDVAERLKQMVTDRASALADAEQDEIDPETVTTPIVDADSEGDTDGDVA